MNIHTNKKYLMIFLSVISDGTRDFFGYILWFLFE